MLRRDGGGDIRGWTIRGAIRAIRARMRVRRLGNISHASRGADANGDAEPICEKVGKEDVLATSAAVVSAIEGVGDVAPRNADFDAEGLSGKCGKRA